MKKIHFLGIFLVSALMISAIGTFGNVDKDLSAEPGTIPGTSLTWSFDDTDGTLTIGGTGSMSNKTGIPWVDDDFLLDIRFLIIGDGITTIGANMFNGCENLLAVTLPSSVKHLDHGAFEGCTGLNTIDLSSLTSMNSNAFKGCINLKNVNISSITMLGTYSFSGCSSIESITLPSTMTGSSLSSYAFENCTGLKNITINATLTGIGTYTFVGCSSLKTITLPSTILEVHDRAFERCTSLKIVIMPSVTKIGPYTFDDCTSLEIVSMPEVLTIGENAFRGCTSLTMITMPKVTTVGENAFRGCDSLSEVSMPEAVTVKDMAFYLCSQLTEVTMPKVVTIENNAFRGTGLVKAIMPEVTVIKPYALSGCMDLVEVSMPKIVNIANSAFYFCPQLIEITMAVPTSISASAFALGIDNDTRVTCTVYTSTEGILDDYKNDYTTFIYVTGPVVKHDVSVTGGTASPASAATGAIVTLTPGSAPLGKQFKSWSVTEAGGGSINGNSFTVGTADATIVAVWQDVLTVNVTGGTVSPAVGVTGTVVTLTPGAPEEGKQFKAWVVNVSGGGNLSGNSFTIGTGNATIVAVWEIVYVAVGPAGGEFKKGSEDGYTITVEADFSKFAGVHVDGTVIPTSNYEAKAGSTIITLKNEYLSTLSVGTHTVDVVFDDGVASTSLKIVSDGGSGNDDGTDMLMIAVVIAIIAAVSLAVVYFFILKKP